MYEIDKNIQIDYSKELGNSTTDNTNAVISVDETYVTKTHNETTDGRSVSHTYIIK